MYPTLFQIGSFRLESYSVMWFIALSLAIIWAIRRLAIYDIDEDEARRVMAVSFFFMLLGARSPEYFRNFRDYMADPSLLLDLNRGGLEEGGAIMGAFFSALVMCRLRKVSFLNLCEVAAIPAFLAICIGRWGCFLNGCCSGQVTNFVTGLHFPYDKPGIIRHPTQIYYSIFALACVLLLIWLEKKNLSRKNPRPVIAPLALILYAFMRFAVAPLREPQDIADLVMHYWKYKALIIALPLECLWLLINLRKGSSDKHEKLR